MDRLLGQHNDQPEFHYDRYTQGKTARPDSWGLSPVMITQKGIGRASNLIRQAGTRPDKAYNKVENCWPKAWWAILWLDSLCCCHSTQYMQQHMPHTPSLWLQLQWTCQHPTDTATTNFPLAVLPQGPSCLTQGIMGVLLMDRRAVSGLAQHQTYSNSQMMKWINKASKH